MLETLDCYVSTRTTGYIILSTSFRESVFASFLRCFIINVVLNSLTFWPSFLSGILDTTALSVVMCCAVESLNHNYNYYYITLGDLKRKMCWVSLKTPQVLLNIAFPSSQRYDVSAHYIKVSFSPFSRA